MNKQQAIERLKGIVDFYKLNDENNYDYSDEVLISMRIALEEIERLNNIINELDKQNGELGADLSIIKDRVIKTNWWLENMLKQATNGETKAIINGALDLLLGSDKE